MWYARGLWPLVCFLLASGPVEAQTVFHNDGNVVHVSAGAVVFVQGSVNNLNDGRLNNGGTIHFSADWTSNTAVSDDVDALPGTYVFEGVQQDLIGADEIRFSSVELRGSVARVVQRNSDVSVAGTFLLEDAEWATRSHRCSVTNPDPAAVTRDRGYVSSDSVGGALVRRTDRTEAYLYPVGSTGAVHRNPQARFRPVYLTPVAPAENDFSVRFANVDATDDDTGPGAVGFDVDARNPALTDINREYYFNIDRERGDTPVDVAIYYPKEDGRFSTVAQRQETEVWEDAYGAVVLNAAAPVHTAVFDRVARLFGHDDFTQTLFTQAGADQDDDGIADRDDLDADNDGIANVDEVPSDPYADHDGDDYFDYIDADFPGCGGLVNGICANFDFDRDGKADHLDLDSDGDGLLDIVEAGGVDPELDGQVAYAIAGVPSSMLDADLDGFHDPRDHLDGGNSPDASAEVTDGTPWPQPDRDGDGLRNFRDVDADGDGLPDFVEAQATAFYYVPDSLDADGNGIDQAFDRFENVAGFGVVAVDTDGDGEPDYLDYNSDDERTADIAEGHDTDGDGLYDGPVPTGADADGDGLDDVFDQRDRDVAYVSNATNGQFAQVFANFEAPGTDERDWRERGCKQQDCKPIVTERNQVP